MVLSQYLGPAQNLGRFQEMKFWAAGSLEEV